MTVMLAYILVASMMLALLYSWLGLPYVPSLMMALLLIGVGVNETLAALLGSQVVASLAGSYFRRSLVSDVNIDVKHSVVIGFSALTSFIAALALGVRLSEDARLLSVAIMMLFAAALVKFEVGIGRSVDNAYLGDLLVGIVAGSMKGVLGAGMTPVLIALQRLVGLGFDETMFRTLLSQAVICTAALIPYSVVYGLDPLIFTVLCAGSVLGTALGHVVLRPLSPKTRSLLSFIVMILFSAALFVEAFTNMTWGFGRE